MTPPSRPAVAARRSEEPRIVFGSAGIGVDDVVALAHGLAVPALSADPQWRARIQSGRDVLARALAEGRTVYGVSTGVGASVDTDIPSRFQSDLPHNLFRMHGCGTGAALDRAETAAVVAARLASLCRGYSAVRLQVLEHLAALLAAGVLPRIPEEGSVGASGDLTPLSYVAALLAGEGEAVVGGALVGAPQALAAAGLEPLVLEPKESLALMNGTSVMAGIGALALSRADRIARAACAVTAMVSAATGGNREHFDERILGLKPHAGTLAAGGWIRSMFGKGDAEPALRVQDRYSIRCAPHVIGVLADAVTLTKSVLDIEIGGVNDNPVVDADGDCVLHGGNFYGGHVVFALDALKGAMAGVADLLDRQLVLLCLPETSGGLPANLVGRSGEAAVAHHGFKAMQITASALAAEALKTSLPAAVFSRSTESHNQDKVSMGTIAAREARRLAELGETVVAIVLLGACQAVDLRLEEGGRIPEPLMRLHEAVRERVPALAGDRRQDRDIAEVLELLRADALPLPPSSYLRAPAAPGHAPSA
ncbi:MAG TPA: aromatic amino acid ammonia-lyase [Candidatus Limnocylindrales bacterium]|nr:aromatic amino acid ammonia-lyase [Candidatus Limnocylindrales bacterium]